MRHADLINTDRRRSATARCCSRWPTVWPPSVAHLGEVERPGLGAALISEAEAVVAAAQERDREHGLAEHAKARAAGYRSTPWDHL